MSEPTVPSSLPGRQPTTTASIVRTRLILDMPTRSPGLYGASWRLAITPSAPCEPRLGLVGDLGARREVERRGDHRLQAVAALGLRQLQQRLVAVRQQVEGDEARRRLLGEHLDARLGGVDALAEGVEVLPAVGVEEDDLPVEHVAALREGQFREIAAQRLPAARLQVYVRAVDEGERAESVPLGLVDPARARRQLLRRTGELREERWREGQRHGAAHIRALGERGALVEAGAILGGERDSHTQCGDESDDEHAPTIGACGDIVLGLIDFGVDR